MNTETNESESKQTPDDDTILELARRRLAIKKNLFSQTIDYLLILLCLASLGIFYDYETKVFICFIFSLFWGVRLLYRIFKFAKPSFKDGIAAYIKKRNDYQLRIRVQQAKKRIPKQVNYALVCS